MLTRQEIVGKVLDFFRTNRKAYQLTFGGAAGEEVLLDLARFCRATTSVFVPGDERLTDVLIGRHEVWLRIQERLGLSSEQLYQKYGVLLVQKIEQQQESE